MFDSLLLALDLTRGSKHLLTRAAQLPRTAKLRLTLLHVVPPGFGKQGTERAVVDALHALDELRRELPAGLRRAAETVVKCGSVDRHLAAVAKKSRAELVLIGRTGGHAVRDALLGSTAERVIRNAKVPVLVVRSAAAKPYQRPLLALDLDAAARRAIRLLLQVVPAPRPPLALVHVHRGPPRGMIYPSLPAKDARLLASRERRQAVTALNQLLSTETPLSSDITWKAHLLAGAPRSVIRDTALRLRADLLALGTHGYSAPSRVMLGSVAGDVLREARCDVLIVPPTS